MIYFSLEFKRFFYFILVLQQWSKPNASTFSLQQPTALKMTQSDNSFFAPAVKAPGVELATGKSAFYKVVPRPRESEEIKTGHTQDAGPMNKAPAILASTSLNIGNILQEVTAQILFSTIKRLRINQFYLK